MTSDQPVQAERPYLSFSRLSTYRQCPAKYRFRYVQHVEERSSGALIGGKAVHQVIELAEQNRWWEGSDEDEIDRGIYYMEFEFRKDFTAALDAAGGEDKVRWGGRKSREFPNGEDARWWLKNGVMMLKRYGAERRRDHVSGMVLHEDGVEMAVSCEIDVTKRVPNPDRPGEWMEVSDTVLVKGYVDALLMVNRDGQRIVRDYKTGTFQETTQLPIYGYLLQAGPGIAVHGGELVMLRYNDNRVKSFDITNQIPLVPDMFRGLIANLETEQFQIQPSMFCPSCTVRHVCPWGKTLPADA
jgi:hypothetical protein